MNDPAVARVEPTPNDWLARAAKYAAEPWWLIAAGYAAVLLAIVFSLAAVPVLSLARQTFAFLGILFGAWALWTRMRKPWQAEEPTQAYLWAFLVPLVLMCFVAIEALMGKPFEEYSGTLAIFALIQVVACAGLGVVMRLRAVQKGNGNTHAAAVLYAAAGIALLAMFSQEPEWDSATLLLRVAISLCLLGGFLVALPQLIRRILITAFFVYHFIGISMAATALPIQRQPPGWINLELYERVYRHYLHFMYLTNAYHYYSPDPGPPQLLYFCIEYAPCDRYPAGAHSWISIPKREDFRTRLEYQRRLGVTESTNDTTGFVPIPLQGVLYRYHNTQCYKVPGREALIIDDLELAHLGLTPGTMILKPSAYSQTMLRTYARYVATHYPLLDERGDPVPGGKVSSVKVYKVTHNILSQAEFEKGKDPLDPDKYFPVFEGEFDSEGNLFPNDGFLYTPLPKKWVEDRSLIPDNWKLLPEEYKEETDEDGHVHNFYLIDRMRMHGELLRRPYPSLDSHDKGTK